MPRRFEELLKARSYEDIKSKELPTLQRCIYDGLKGLTPSRLDFILHEDYPSLEVNQQRMDRDTHYIICGILKELTEDKRLLVTNDDLLCAWQRIKELIFFKQAVKQGIIVERPAQDGSVEYWCETLPGQPTMQQNINLIDVAKALPTCQVWRIA
jgi:hypothetical protein